MGRVGLSQTAAWRPGSCQGALVMKKGLLAAALFLLACAGSARADGEPTPDWDYWVDFGYIHWWLRGAPMPEPLVTTGFQTGIPGVGNGILNQSGTSVVYGDSRFPETQHNGFQITAGRWFDYCQNFQWTANFFYLANNTPTATLGSDPMGNPLLARPVVDARTNAETVEYISAPSAFAGNLTINSTTGLMGAESNVAVVADRWEGGYFNLLAGFRWLEVRQQLDLNQTSQELLNGVAFFQGTPLLYNRFTVDDNFLARNDYLGGQIGAQVGYCYSRFIFNLAMKFGVGDCRQDVKVNGSTTATTLFGQSTTAAGGLLALPTNMGRHVRNTFAVLPSADASIMFEITPQFHLMVGYNFLYINDVALPGDQIDRNINRTQLPTSQAYNTAVGGPAKPEFTFHGSDFWAQGITAGFSIWF
jgi:hypothetical protein